MYWETSFKTFESTFSVVYTRKGKVVVEYRDNLTDEIIFTLRLEENSARALADQILVAAGSLSKTSENGPFAPGTK